MRIFFGDERITADQTIHPPRAGRLPGALRRVGSERDAIRPGAWPEVRDAALLAQGEAGGGEASILRGALGRRTARVGRPNRDIPRRRNLAARLLGIDRGGFAQGIGSAMLSLPSSARVLAACEPVDMRKSFNGLFAAASQELGEDPTSGTLFLFSNRKRNLLKILYWDGSGLWVLAKRLEKGRFSWPVSGGAAKIDLKSEAFGQLIAGVQLDDEALVREIAALRACVPVVSINMRQC